MLELKPTQVALSASPKTKEEAIEMVAALLVENGNIDPRYIESMFGREKVANTFLANGIAIPHGLPENREYILQTGIVVLQVPDGVTWNEGETARLIVGIAAKSDEHLGILRSLTHVVADEDEANRLAETTDKGDIIESLTGERPQVDAAKDAEDLEHVFSAVIQNKTGLHARPATELVTLAKGYQAQMQVRVGSQVADAKSIVSILQLGAAQGTTVHVSAQGEDAQEALDAIKAGIESGLGEEEEAAPTVKADRVEWTPTEGTVAFGGVPASDGIVVGSIHQYQAQIIVVEDDPALADSALEDFEHAVEAAILELNKLHKEVKKKLGSGQAAIFLVHAEFLADTELLNDTKALISKRHSAAWAWQETINGRITALQNVDDPVLAGRAIDLGDVGQRVLRHLLGKADEVSAEGTQPAVLVADDLTPSDTANLDPDLILGFITAKGGPTSHTAIIARAMGIPAVVAAGTEVLEITENTSCILDGFNGQLYLDSQEADVEEAERLHAEFERQLDEAYQHRLEAAKTTDGFEIEVFANVNRVADAVKAVEFGAEGVGLMRTEFLFLESGRTPSEEEQYEVYRDMANALGGRPLTIRTLDIGGDKQVAHLDLPKEDNSFLGIRGIRLCFARPDLFMPQLHAIYRAAKEENIRIMFPMISTIDDLEQAIALTEEARKEVDAPKIELGIMVEVPSAAVMADQFAKMVDFFSVGTNDLTQYTLAMDRLHPQLARQADALNPAVLRMVDMTVRAADKEGKWVGVCGGAASDTKAAAILVGLGVKELSVTVPAIPTIKAHLRSSSLEDLQELAQAALACRTAKEVHSL